MHSAQQQQCSKARACGRSVRYAPRVCKTTWKQTSRISVRLVPNHQNKRSLSNQLKHGKNCDVSIDQKKRLQITATNRNDNRLAYSTVADSSRIACVYTMCSSVGHVRTSDIRLDTVLRACELGDQTTVRTLVELDRFLVINGDQDGVTALHLAARHGHHKLMHMLLAYKPTVSHPPSS